MVPSNLVLRNRLFETSPMVRFPSPNYQYLPDRSGSPVDLRALTVGSALGILSLGRTFASFVLLGALAVHSRALPLMPGGPVG